MTGRQLEALFSAAAGRPIPYSRFSDEVLAASPFLHKLTGLVDDGRLAGHADLDAMRQLHPQLHTFAGWLAGPGRPAFERALTSGASWAFNRSRRYLLCAGVSVFGRRDDLRREGLQVVKTTHEEYDCKILSGFHAQR